ncbi:MAG: transcriptional regulator [Halapricum sp.]
MADTERTQIDRVVTIDPETAHLLASEIRAVLLDELGQEARSIDELVSALDERGFDLADTSVRHHVGVLREGGAVTVVRREDVNGGTRKYYRATMRAYAYDTADADQALQSMQGLVRAELLSLCSRLAATHRDDFVEAAAELDAEAWYEHGHPGPYVIRELLDRALTDLEESGTLDDRLPPVPDRTK